MKHFHFFIIYYSNTIKKLSLIIFVLTPPPPRNKRPGYSIMTRQTFDQFTYEKHKIYRAKPLQRGLLLWGSCIMGRSSNMRVVLTLSLPNFSDVLHEYEKNR